MATLADVGVHQPGKAATTAVSARVESSHELQTSPGLQKEAATFLAETLVADAVSFALNVDGRSLRALARDIGLDAAFLSRLASGKNCTVSSLAMLSLGLGKKLHISIE